MSIEKWPDAKVRYHVDDSDAGKSRWQTAIDAGTNAGGGLTLTPPSNGLKWARDLAGKCPRCGHDIV